MSKSEPGATLLLRLLRGLEGGDLDAVSLTDLTEVLAASIRLASSKAEQVDELIALTDRQVSATQAVTVASALLHAQHLNAFDLELWSAGRHAPH